MLRRRIAKHYLRNLFILTLACFCGSIILIGEATSTRVAAKRPSVNSQEGAQKLSPENLSTTMYGSNGGHSNSDSINDGSLVIIDQSTAAITLVGHPNGIDRLTGLTFDSTGILFASTQPAGGFPPPPPPMTSKLVTINPANGSLVSTIGTISDGAAISIADLAVQPGTDLLFGVRGPNDGNNGQGNLYTINKSTGAATLVGNTGAFFASIAFAPDGTLYEAAADLGMMGNVVNVRIMKVNPSNGAIISSVPTSQLFGALGVRPTDGVIFGGNGDSHQIFTINATTGTATLIGDTGQNFVGDLAFSPVSNVGINAYRQTNLVSDIPGAAQILDPNLVNPWGVSFSATSPFWISNNGSGTATLYAGDNGTPLTKNPLTVTIPGGGNTGIVFNGSSDFVITDGTGTGAARFIFATEAGTIAAWRAGTVAGTKVTTPNSVYKGLAIGNNGTANFLYAANFNSGKIEVFDKNFAAATLAGNFTDPALPAGYAPFNIQNLGGKLYVMYALQDADKKDDVPGAGHGFVDTFDLNGNLLGRLISAGALNSPWGIALSPANFGQFGGNELLIGNFGDGKINAFNQTTGASLGTLNDQSGNPLVIDGLWALAFGNGSNGGDPNTLYFSAGLGDESHGLFGKLNAASPASVFVEFSSPTYSVSEGAGFIDISVTRSGVTSTPLTVNFATYDEPGAGKASAMSDFIPTLGTLSFASGEITKTFSVLLVDDGYVEGDETFKVILSNPTGSALKPTTIAEVTITDNDTASTTIPTPLTFVASLNGAQEVPPKVTNGKGTGVVIITDEASGAAKVSIAFSGLTSNENAAHIHGPGAPGVNAPILFPLPNAPATSGSVNDFSFTMTPAQIQQLRSGLFYINVH
ncbi:MAG TPA: TIGR03118 family protein, partial [Pyrinomonadaceae bacterium]